MREFTKVASKIWTSRRFRGLLADPRLLLLYFITCQHQTSAGCFALPDGYATVDLDWTLDRYRTARGYLIEQVLIIFDDETKEIFISNWFRHCPPVNPSHRKSILAAISQLSSGKLRAEVLSSYTAVAAAIDEEKAAKGSTAGVHHLNQTAHLRR